LVAHTQGDEQVITKDFVLAGKSIFTVELPAGFDAPHYTFRVRKSEATERWPAAYWVNLLTGPDNTADYQPVGKLDPETGIITLTKNSRFTNDTFPVRLVRRVVGRLWANEPEAITAAGFDVHHEGRCGRCGRVLTVPESLETGLGPECAARV
jgi:hypothetical protein